MIAQLVERKPEELGVGGSNPPHSTFQGSLMVEQDSFFKTCAHTKKTNKVVGSNPTSVNRKIGRVVKYNRCESGAW